jgi:type I restriction enzyme R subunit
VEEKGALVNALREAADDLRAFCAERDVDLDALGRLAGFELVAAGKQTVEMLMADDDEKVAFVARAALVDRLYKAILPDRRANEFSRLRAVSKFLADALAAYTERPDISGVIGSVEQLLDESVAAQEYLIPDSDAEALTVGTLAAGLDLMLPAVSGVLTDRTGLIIRHSSASLYIPADALLSA